MKPLAYVAALILSAGPVGPTGARGDDARAGNASADPPNIVLIISDDHSHPHFGLADGQTKTPNLDRLAREGMYFSRAYVTCPQCAPSRSSFVTGRSPIALGTTRFPAPLPRDVPIYQEILDPLGYFTGMGGRAYHLDGKPGNGQDIRDVYAAKNLGNLQTRLDYLKQAGGKNRLKFREQCLDQFREMLDEAGDAPFAVQIGFSDPHRGWDRQHIPDPQDPSALELPPFFPDTKLVRDDFADYLDEVNRVDGSVGRILDELDDRGLAENTLVMFVGDNGASLLRGKGTLWEMGVRVPLIARWPGRIAPGGTSDALISGEDLAPTYIEAAGGTPPESMTGRSFLNLLLGEPYEEREYVFAERGPHADGLPVNQSAFDLGRTIVGRRYKLIYTATWMQPYNPTDASGQPFWKQILQLGVDGKLSDRQEELFIARTRPMFELYDLENDRWEMTNLIGDPGHKQIAEELKRELMLWMQGERDFIPIPTGNRWGTPALPEPGGKAPSKSPREGNVNRTSG